MLEKITWAQYLTGAAMLALVYYAVVLLLYRRKVLDQFKQARKNYYHPITSDQPMEETSQVSNDLEKLALDIRHSILEPGKQASKHELFRQIVDHVANFGGLLQPGSRYALNNYIIQQAKEICGVDFSEEELEAAWDSLPR